MRKSIFLLVTISSLLCTRAMADFIPIATPTATYESETNLVPITPPDYTFLTAISDPQLTITFSQQMQTRTVPVSWGSWGSPPYTESNTPRVLEDFFMVPSVTLTLSAPEEIFGIEVEPTLISLHTISVQFFSDGTLVGVIQQNEQGYAGARLFAAMSSANPFTSVTVTADPTADGFALAEIRQTVVPEPSCNLLLISVVLGLVSRSFKRAVRKAG